MLTKLLDTVLEKCETIEHHTSRTSTSKIDAWLLKKSTKLVMSVYVCDKQGRIGMMKVDNCRTVNLHHHNTASFFAYMHPKASDYQRLYNRI
jgi:hypothetical protein